MEAGYYCIAPVPMTCEPIFFLLPQKLVPSFMSSFIQIIDYNSNSSTESLHFKIQMHFHLLHQKKKNQRICILELPDLHAGFRKDRGIRDQIANIRWITEKARVPGKHLLLLYRLHQCL